MAVKTKGTQLFFLTPGSELDPVRVIKVGAVTSISGINASRDQIETTDLESEAHTYESGLMAPGAATFAIQFDPSNEGHRLLHGLFLTGEVLHWALCWSDGTAAPTTVGDAFVFPTTRSFLKFDGYVADCPFDFSLNNVVNSSISVQISGFPELVAKA